MDDVLASLELTRRRFTVEEYYRMAEVGILTEQDRVELIEGEIVQMAPIGDRHASCVARLIRRLAGAVGDRAFLWPQNPVRLLPDTVPQPDVALLRPRPDDYSRQSARPADVLLLIEVADMTYRYDHGVKLPLYAHAAIVEVWIIDLPGEAVEIHRGPGPRGYASSLRVGRGSTLSPAALADVVLLVDEILPPP